MISMEKESVKRPVVSRDGDTVTINADPVLNALLALMVILAVIAVIAFWIEESPQLSCPAPSDRPAKTVSA